MDLAKSKIGALTEDGVHYLPIIGMDAPSVEAVEAFNNYSYDSFDEFVTKNFGIAKVTMHGDPKFLSTATCTCSDFFKIYVCKHIIGMALRLKLVEIPLEVKKVCRKTKRGRPKQRSKTHMFQSTHCTWMRTIGAAFSVHGATYRVVDQLD